MQDSQFQGHEEEFKAFKRVLADQAGQAVVVIGPPGSGKSESLQKMLQEARDYHSYAVERAIVESVTVRADQSLSAMLITLSGNLSRARPITNVQDYLKLLCDWTNQSANKERLVIGVDAEKTLPSDSANMWLQIIRSLPERVKMVFTQRPDDVLASNDAFMSLPNAVRMPIGQLPLPDHSTRREKQVDGVLSSKTDSESKPIWAGTFSLHGFPINLKNLWSWVGTLEGWKKPVICGVLCLLIVVWLTDKWWWWIPMLHHASRQGTTNTSIDNVNEGLKRIAFSQDCSKPLMGMSVVVTLKRTCTPEDLSHFRFLVEILNLHEPEPYPALWIGGRDAYSTWHTSGVSQRRMGVKSLVWSQTPDEQIQNTIFGTGAATTTQLEAGGYLYKHGPYKTLGDLDRRCMAIYMTKPLLDLTAGVYVMANDYWIAGNTADRFVPLDLTPAIAWPEPISETEARVSWVAIALRIEHPPEWMNPELARTGWSLDFSTFTPEKQAFTKY